MKGFRGQIQCSQKGETCEGELDQKRSSHQQTMCRDVVHSGPQYDAPKSGSSAQFAWSSLYAQASNHPNSGTEGTSPYLIGVAVS